MTAPLAVDPSLVRGWLAARSLSRGLPQPVDDHGGWRVDAGLPEETRRYVFARPCAGLRQLADMIDEPLVFLKLCGSRDLLRSLLPARWAIQPPSYMMVCAREPAPASAVTPGYRPEITRSGDTTAVRILAENGDVAASGHAAELGGFFVYDRIVTAEAHRRRGLGTAVMALLGEARRSGDSRRVLTATEAGRALYATIGWTVHSPYSTAVLLVRPQKARSPTTLPAGE